MDLDQMWQEQKAKISGPRQQGQGDIPAASAPSSKGVSLSSDKGGRPSEGPAPAIGSSFKSGDGNYPETSFREESGTGSFSAYQQAQYELDRRFTDPYKDDPKAPKRRGRVGGMNYDPLANKWF